jgi:DNA-binding response OmpR family regulator
MSDFASGQTILLIEDEQTLRLASAMLLEKRGFSVIAAEGGSAGINLFRSQPDNIDVVLLDMSLPDITGVQVFREIRRLKPDARILMTSAYNREKVQADFKIEEQELFQFIRKPYRTDELVHRLRQVLA